MIDRPVGQGLTLAAVVKFLITTLTLMARERAWGEVRVTVQNGQPEFVHVDRSYRDRLPGQTDQDAKALAAIIGQG